MRISRYKDEYQVFLTRFTDKLLQLTQTYTMPPFQAQSGRSRTIRVHFTSRAPVERLLFKRASG